MDDEEQALKYFRKEFKHEYPILTAPGAAQALTILEKEHAPGWRAPDRSPDVRARPASSC